MTQLLSMNYPGFSILIEPLLKSINFILGIYSGPNVIVKKKFDVIFDNQETSAILSFSFKNILNWLILHREYKLHSRDSNFVEIRYIILSLHSTARKLFEISLTSDHIRIINTCLSNITIIYLIDDEPCEANLKNVVEIIINSFKKSEDVKDLLINYLTIFLDLRIFPKYLGNKDTLILQIVSFSLFRQVKSYWI